MYRPSKCTDPAKADECLACLTQFTQRRIKSPIDSLFDSLDKLRSKKIPPSININKSLLPDFTTPPVAVAESLVAELSTRRAVAATVSSEKSNDVEIVKPVEASKGLLTYKQAKTVYYRGIMVCTGAVVHACIDKYGLGNNPSVIMTKIVYYGIVTRVAAEYAVEFSHNQIESLSPCRFQVVTNCPTRLPIDLGSSDDESSDQNFCKIVATSTPVKKKQKTCESDTVTIKIEKGCIEDTQASKILTQLATNTVFTQESVESKGDSVDMETKKKAR
jgi:hypothetical protein